MVDISKSVDEILEARSFVKLPHKLHLRHTLARERLMNENGKMKNRLTLQIVRAENGFVITVMGEMVRVKPTVAKDEAEVLQFTKKILEQLLSVS
jgi:hypothetical protein